MNFLKRYKKRIILVISALVILAAAFVFDGARRDASTENHEFNDAPTRQASENSPDPTEKAPVDEVHETNEAHQADGGENNVSQPENAPLPEESGTASDNPDSSALLTKSNPTENREVTDAVLPEISDGDEKAESNPSEYACTVSISCAAVLDNMDMLDEDKADFIPDDGVILKETTVKLENGDSVFDLLARVTKENSIHMEFTDTPVYKTKYIEGIANIYELDCGSLSGWQYSVNGVFPNVGCSAYYPENGDIIEWKYTCDLGRDIGNAYTSEKENG